MTVKVKQEDHYINEDGLLVFTEAYHLKRGFCCGCACKHCPYGHINVPEKSKRPAWKKD